MQSSQNPQLAATYLPIFRSQLQVAAAASSTQGYHTGAGGYFTAPTTSRPPSLAANPRPANSSNNIEVPLVSSDYGYGHRAHELGAAGTSGVFPATATTNYSATSTASAYARMHGESSRARHGRGRGINKTGRNLLNLAGYGSSFVKEGHQPAQQAVVSSRGAAFGRPIRRPTGRGRALGRGVALGRGASTPKAKVNPMVPRQPNVFQNLGRQVQPKNPVSLLSENMGYRMSQFSSPEVNDDDYEKFNEENGYYPDQLYKAELTVNGKRYVAAAETKKDAKDACAAKVFPDLLLAGLKEQKGRPKQKDPTGMPVQYEMMEDEVPWAMVCSLALYRLYTDWQSEGFDIPEHLLNFQGVGTIIKDGRSTPVVPPGTPKPNPTPGVSDAQSNLQRDNLNFKYIDIAGKTGSMEQAQIPVATPSQQAMWRGSASSQNQQSHYQQPQEKQQQHRHYKPSQPHQYRQQQYRAPPVPPGEAPPLPPPRGLSQLQQPPPHLQQPPPHLQQPPPPKAPTGQRLPGTMQPQVPNKLIEYANGKVINPVSKHPVQLLNELLPSLVYQEQEFGTRTRHFVTTIVVKGESYIGEASNKKEAKNFAAVNALKGAYGIVYPSFPTQEFLS